MRSSYSPAACFTTLLQLAACADPAPAPDPYASPLANCTATTTTDADGIEETWEASTYDARGREVLYQFPSGVGDEVYDHTSAYDAWDNQTEYHDLAHCQDEMWCSYVGDKPLTCTRATGEPAQFSVEDWVYEEGLLVEHTRAYGVEEATVVVGMRQDYAYDALRQLVWDRTDYDADGTWDTMSIYAYDEAGNVVERVDASGDEATRYTYAYDARSRMVYAADDANADGSIEAESTWTYDGGNLVEETYAGDGTDWVTTTTWDEEDRMSTRWQHSDEDPDWGSSESWTYDELGRQATHGASTRDGSSTRVETTEYACN